MLRLTRDNRSVAEVAAVAEHIASLTAAAAAFQLTPDVPTPRPGGETLIPPVGPDGVGDAADTLAEIEAWARPSLGIGHVPAIWQALAHDPKLLATTWRKDRLVMAPGTLDELVKGSAALAVAQFRQSPYWIAYLTQYLRAHCGVDDRVLVEIAGSVMHYVSFNTIAHGMRLEPPFSGMDHGDVGSGGRFEQLVPGARKRLSPSS